MIKRLFSFVCCLVPFGAMGAQELLTPDDSGNITLPLNADMGTNTYVVTYGNNAQSLAVTVDGAFKTGGALNVWATSETGTAGGLSILNAAEEDKTLYTNTFTLTSVGDVTIGGGLNVLAGNNRGFALTAANNSSPINATISSINNKGILELTGIKALKIGTDGSDETGTFFVPGAVENMRDLKIAAQTVDMGALTSGKTEPGATVATISHLNIQATGAVNIAHANVVSQRIENPTDIMTDEGFIDAGGSLISGGSIRFTEASESATETTTKTLLGFFNELGAVRLTATDGDIDIAGTVTNSGQFLQLKASGDVIVGESVSNLSQGGQLNITGQNLKINGGALANAGDLYLVMSGETYIKDGFDLSGMGANNTFNVSTGTLKFGGSAALNSYSDKFTLNVTAGGIDLQGGAIHNGQVGKDLQPRSDANMTILAGSLQAASIANDGRLLAIDTVANAATAQDGSLTLGGGITGKDGSTTNITADGALVAQGVSNSGIMKIQAPTITLASVVNSDNIANNSVLTILGSTDVGGAITIGSVDDGTGTVTNTGGTLGLSARQISVGGAVTNSGGTMTIRGSDSDGGNITLGALAVDGGMVNMNALITDGIQITNDLAVRNDGVLNVGASTRLLKVGGAVTVNGDVVATSRITPDTAGSMNVAASGTGGFELKSDTSISVGGNIIANATDAARSLTFDAENIGVNGDVIAENAGQQIIFGGTQTNNLTVDGGLIANAGGVIDLRVNDVDVGTLDGTGKFIVRGMAVADNQPIQAGITASSNVDNAINIQNGIWMGTNEGVSAGLVGLSDELTLETSGDMADINVAGGIEIAADKKLSLSSQDNIVVSGEVKNAQGTLVANAKNLADFQGDIASNTGLIRVNASAIQTRDITSNGTVNLTANGIGTIDTGKITVKSGDVSLNGGALTSSIVQVDAGRIEATGNTWNVLELAVADGAVANLNVLGLTVDTDIDVTGDLVQGNLSGTSGALNLRQNNMTLAARNMTIDGNLNAVGLAATYNIDNLATITGDILTAPAADVDIHANRIIAGDVDNRGTLRLAAENGITLGAVNNQDGALTLDAGTYVTNVTQFDLTGGTASLAGRGMTVAGDFTIAGRLQQDTAGMANGDVNVTSANYNLNAANVVANGILQSSGAMNITTSDLDIQGDIVAKNLRILARGKANNVANDWLTVNVSGDVSGGVGFIGLKSMDVGGSYIFNDNSLIHAAIMPATETGGRNYWASVSLAEDNTLGTITNGATGAEPLMSVNGKFVSNITNLGEELVDGAALGAPQIGIDLFDIVDQGTAIWLMHADGGLDEFALKMRNLFVKFCNADGTQCFDYINSINIANNGSAGKKDLPAYLTTRDTDGDGVADSIYIVFDPRFGGPVEVFKIQEVVGRESDHTAGEYSAAGALDEMIAGKLASDGFYNRTPIEAIPLIFQDTNVAQLAQQVYDRMEYYNTYRDGAPLARISRLVQPREAEQIMGSIVLNEHTSFRDFEDRMLDEFIWNRNRNLNKIWLDLNIGMYSQNLTDGKSTDGNRFSAQAGIDWQSSDTLILGLTARASHMSGSNSDDIELGYLPGQHIAGHVDIDVSDTNLGLGGYMVKTLGTKARIYGNLFGDVHLLNVDREQNYVGKITGDGTAMAVTTEWGFMHDWLNQYIVGNLYMRGGYNLGFTVKEKVDGDAYMNVESDGYAIVTPGYTLMAQKRIYPNAWSQLRPYASAGVEYDILGAPDKAKYKFAAAQNYTDYAVDLDPLWINAGAGVEYLMSTGWQFGLDYRYQYNSEIQLHQVKFSGSYRF
ncbi:hypothetical protein HDR63_02745 [bacterium]|nr:hypothetical protein [bacterium]